MEIEKLLDQIKALQNENKKLKTDLKEQKNALKNLEQVFHKIQIGIILLDKNFRIKKISPFIFQHFDIPKNAISHPIDKYAYDINRHSLLDDLNISKNKNITLELEIPHKNGNYYRLIIKPSKDKNGIFRDFLLTFFDITDNKKVEYELHENRYMFESFMNASPILAWIKDMDLEYTFMNQSYLKGLNLENLENGKNDFDFYKEEVAELVRSNDRKILKTGKTAQFFQSAPLANGKTHHFQVYKFPLIDYNRMPFIGGIGIDITNRKIAEEKLISSEANYRTLVDNMPEIQFKINKELKFEFVNKVLVETLQIPENDLLGRNVFQIGLPKSVAERINSAFKKVFKSNKTRQTYIQLPIREKRYFCSAKIVPIENLSKEIESLVILLSDITELKEAERKIKRLNKNLEKRVELRTKELLESNKELESFNYSVSHDLRSPIRSIQSYTSIFLEDYEEILDEDAKQLISTVTNSANKMGLLVDGLLAFSRLGKTAVNKQNIDITNLFQEEFNRLKILHKNQKIKLILHKCPNAKADPILIQQVAINLLSNAIKYSAKKPETLIEIGFNDSEKHYFIKDNGVGFDEKYAEKIFGVFERVHKERDFSGTGVGLAIVKRIIEKHKGKIWAKAKINEGAIFYFSLGN